MNKPEKSDLLIGTITAAIILAISILVGKAMDLVALKTVVIGIVIFVVIILGIVSIVHLVQQASHDEELGVLFRDLQQLIPPTGFEWLHRNADLSQIESQVKGKDIWIVSPDFNHDLIQKDFQALTKENFKRGITYTYIIPKSEAMYALVPALRHAYAEYLDQIKIRHVPEDVFRVLAVTHIDIYNPNMSDNEGVRVFLELPVRQKGYWVEISQEAALGIVGRFRKFAEDESLT